jgi:hypothetical protein
MVQVKVITFYSRMRDLERIIVVEAQVGDLLLPHKIAQSIF